MCGSAYIQNEHFIRVNSGGIIVRQVHPVASICCGFNCPKGMFCIAALVVVQLLSILPHCCGYEARLHLSSCCMYVECLTVLRCFLTHNI